MTTRVGEIRIWVDERYCSGCLQCVEFCSRGVLAAANAFTTRGTLPASVARPQDCTGCGLCELFCGDFAISVEKGLDE